MFWFVNASKSFFLTMCCFMSAAGAAHVSDLAVLSDDNDTVTDAQKTLSTMKNIFGTKEINWIEVDAKARYVGQVEFSQGLM